MIRGEGIGGVMTGRLVDKGTIFLLALSIIFFDHFTFRWALWGVIACNLVATIGLLLEWRNANHK